MQPEQDAFGEEIFAYFQLLQAGEQEPAIDEIVEREDGYISVSTALKIYFKPFAEWPAHHRLALEYARGRVLDIGCGAGRVGLYLQDRGFEVVNVDNSPLAVHVCHLRGVKNVYLRSIKQINGRLGRFDTLIMLGNTFGLFGSLDGAKRLLKIFHRLTNPGARLIAESNNIYLTTDPFHLAYHQYNRSRDRLPGQVRLRIRFRKTIGQWFDYLLVSPPEIERIIEGTGWEVERFIYAEAGPLYIGILARQDGS